MSDTFLQRRGEYPYLPDEPKLIENMDTHLPYLYYVSRALNYPVLTGIAELLDVVQPLPYMMYGQNEDINNGYPFLDLPKLIDGMTKPIPYLMNHDNKMDYTEYQVTIPEYKFTIRVPCYKAILQNEIE